MRVAAAMIDQFREGSVQMIEKYGTCDDSANAASTPRYIATPPMRGLGVVCTSRSRISG